MTVDLLLLLAGGLAAGTMGGLLGLGGGIILMPLLRFVVGLPAATAAGTTILAVFFTTLGGTYRHLRQKQLRLASILPLVLTGAAASALFSLVFDYLARRGRWLDLGIGLVFAGIAGRMIHSGFSHRTDDQPGAAGDNRVRGPLWLKLVIGAAAGVLPGLLGIGTGGILVPVLTFLLLTPIKTAMAASLACFSVNAAISAAFKAAQGHIVTEVALPLCLGTVTGANLGAMLNRRFSSRAVKLLFGAVFAYVSLRFVLSFHGANA